MYIAENYLDMQVEERDIYIDKLDEFVEAGACGTAAVIAPIGGIQHKDNFHVFYSETEVGPVTRKLYDTSMAFNLVMLKLLKVGYLRFR